MKRIALLLILALLAIILPTNFVELSYGLHEIQLTTDPWLQDRPALIFAPAYSGLPNRYYFAYQSWEKGEEYGGDIFIEILSLDWTRIKKVRVTYEPSYQDSPCLVYYGAYLYVLYISNEMGPYNIFVQKFDANLNFVYKTRVTESPYPEDRPSAVLLMGEYFYVAYQTWLLGENYYGDICIEVFDSSWHSIKKVMATNDNFYEDSPSVCYIDEFIYVAYVSSETMHWNIFVKKYDLVLETAMKFQLTNDPYPHDMPSINTIITETFNGFSLAYQGWPDEANNGSRSHEISSIKTVHP